MSRREDVLLGVRSGDDVTGRKSPELSRGLEGPCATCVAVPGMVLEDDTPAICGRTTTGEHLNDLPVPGLSDPLQRAAPLLRVRVADQCHHPAGLALSPVTRPEGRVRTGGAASLLRGPRSS